MRTVVKKRMNRIGNLLMMKMWLFLHLSTNWRMLRSIGELETVSQLFGVAIITRIFKKH